MKNILEKIWAAGLAYGVLTETAAYLREVRTTIGAPPIPIKHPALVDIIRRGGSLRPASPAFGKSKPGAIAGRKRFAQIVASWCMVKRGPGSHIIKKVFKARPGVADRPTFKHRSPDPVGLFFLGSKRVVTPAPGDPGLVSVGGSLPAQAAAGLCVPGNQELCRGSHRGPAIALAPPNNFTIANLEAGDDEAPEPQPRQITDHAAPHSSHHLIVVVFVHFVIQFVQYPLKSSSSSNSI